jgi:hypothetical protein
MFNSLIAQFLCFGLLLLLNSILLLPVFQLKKVFNIGRHVDTKCFEKTFKVRNKTEGENANGNGDTDLQQPGATVDSIFWSKVGYGGVDRFIHVSVHSMGHFL